MKAIKKPVEVVFEFAEEDGEIETLEGKFSYKKGDAIITGVKGEKYPCRRDIFDQTYWIKTDEVPEDQLPLEATSILDMYHEYERAFSSKLPYFPPDAERLAEEAMQLELILSQYLARHKERMKNEKEGKR